MSKIEVDTIAPQSGTTVTVGESGDTVTIPTGVTFDASNATTTLPANVVTTDGTQTLTNKSIAATQLTGTITPSDGTVTNAKIVDSTIELAKLSATGTKDATTFLRGDNTFAEAGGGIEEADMWRLTADIVGTNAVISSNLERVDDASFSKIGTGMSVSSGIFSFPSTGLYQILVKMSAYAPSVDNYYVETYATIDNSSYDKIGRVGGSSDNSYENGQSESLFVNVTNTTNVKVKFQTASLAGSTGVLGDTNYNRTSFTFIRLGDSQ